MLRASLIVLFSASFPIAAAGQAPMPERPKHGCEKAEFPGRLGSEIQKRNFQRKFDAYRDCIRKFTEEQNARARIHIDAANAAVDEYNKYVEDVNAEIQKAK